MADFVGVANQELQGDTSPKIATISMLHKRSLKK